MEEPVHYPPPRRRPKHRVEIEISTNAIVKVIVTGCAVWLAGMLWNVIVLVLVSLMMVATFNPMVHKLQHRMSRRWALTTVIIGILAVITLSGALIVPVVLSQGANLLEHLPSYAHNLQDMLAAHGMKVDLHQGMQRVVASVANSVPQLMSLLSNLVVYTFDGVTILVLTIYGLIEGEDVGHSVLLMLPPDWRNGMKTLSADAGTQVGYYVRGQLTLSLMAGVYFLVLLLVLQVPDAIALALVAAIADAIPLVGLIIALIPACLTALSVTPWTAGLVAGFYLFYHQLEANVIAPRIFGKSLGMSVSLIVVAILVGVELMGIAGALLALPVAAALPSLKRFMIAMHEQGQHRHHHAEAPMEAEHPL